MRQKYHLSIGKIFIILYAIYWAWISPSFTGRVFFILGGLLSLTIAYLLENYFRKKLFESDTISNTKFKYKKVVSYGTLIGAMAFAVFNPSIQSLGLHLACMSGRIEAVNVLAILHADLESEEAGFTPLMAATLMHHSDVVRTLLKHGAQVNRVSKNNITALQLAIKNKDVEIEKVLRSARAK